MASHHDEDTMPEETQGYKLSQPKQSLAEYQSMGMCTCSNFLPLGVVRTWTGAPHPTKQFPSNTMRSGIWSNCLLLRLAPSSSSKPTFLLLAVYQSHNLEHPRHHIITHKRNTIECLCTISFTYLDHLLPLFESAAVPITPPGSVHSLYSTMPFIVGHKQCW